MSRQLKYDQVRLSILNIITEDNLKRNEQLPPERELLTRMDCSRITLRKALAELTAEGLLERYVGKGTYLKRNIEFTDRHEKVLFVHVAGSSEAMISMSVFCQLENYFGKSGLDFKYIHATNTTNSVLENAEGAVGILIYGLPDQGMIDTLKTLNLPMILIGNDPGHGLPQVSIDIEYASILATTELLKRGCRKLTLIPGGSQYCLKPGIISGFKKALHQYKIREADIHIPKRFDLQNFMDDFLDKIPQYDGIVMEQGAYFAFLSSCRILNRSFATPMALMPLTDEELNLTNGYVFRGGENTFFVKTASSMFLEAGKMLLDKLCRGTPLKSRKISFVLHTSGILTNLKPYK